MFEKLFFFFKAIKKQVQKTRVSVLCNFDQQIARR